MAVPDGSRVGRDRVTARDEAIEAGARASYETYRGAYGDDCPHCGCRCPHRPARRTGGLIEWGYTDRHGRRWTNIPGRGMQLLGYPHFKPAPTKESRWAKALRRLAATR